MLQIQSLGEVFQAFRRRAWVILVVTVIGCTLSVFAALNQDKVYEATAVVQIEDAAIPDQLAGAMAQSQNAARQVRLIEQRLMARDNLARIMDAFELFLDQPDATFNERIVMMRQAARIEEFGASPQPFSPAAAAPSGLRIVVRLGDPDLAAEVANEFLSQVIDQSRDRSSARARGTLEFFESEEARVGAEMAELEGEIAIFKRQNAEQLPEGVLDLRDQLSSLREADLELDREIVALQTSGQRVRGDVLEQQIALLNDQKALIAERIAQISAQIEGAPEVERALRALERRQMQLQEQYNVITRRRAEAELGQVLEDRDQTDRFEVLETALAPDHPVSRSRRSLAIMGGIASVMAGILAAFALELLNPAMRTAAQVERALGSGPVASIPRISTARDRRRRIAFAALLLAGLFGTGWGVFLATEDRVAWGEILNTYLPIFGSA